MHFAKFIALPTWLLVRVLVSGMDHHPYNKLYPNILEWAIHSNPVFRIFDIALFALVLAFFANILRAFY